MATANGISCDPSICNLKHAYPWKCILMRAWWWKTERGTSVVVIQQGAEKGSGKWRDDALKNEKNHCRARRVEWYRKISQQHHRSPSRQRLHGRRRHDAVLCPWWCSLRQWCEAVESSRISQSQNSYVTTIHESKNARNDRLDIACTSSLSIITTVILITSIPVCHSSLYVCHNLLPQCTDY